ncbi:MAG TPA: hypothetical protein VLH79_10830 [Chthonomonadales bacterium]|nr:hypothetical protein [Chthonomonadales bacterium]
MTVLWLAVAAALAGTMADDGPGFGGAPPLGPRDALRHLFRPYDLVELNVLGAAYGENMLDCRVNATSYTHLNADTPGGDGFHLQFHDDSARFLESLAWEDQYSPIVRLELARRLVKGALAARVPGSFSDSYFRHRSGGKTFLVLGDRQGRDGRMLLSMWGDELTGSLKVGFRLRREGAWVGMDAFRHTDPPGAMTTAAEARGDRWWHASPVTVQRDYAGDGMGVRFTGRYGLSDENRPFEYAFRADAGDGLEITVGEPATPMPLLGDYRLPTTAHLPDRVTSFRSDEGDRTIERPAFRYLILRKTGGAFAATGYSAALLVMWEGQPEQVRLVADKGFGEVRVRWAGREGRVWLNPYYWLDDDDLELVHRSAESFLARGALLQNGFPTQQMLNAVPAGLAAGAYLLTRHRDPLAQTARVNAIRAVDRLFAAEDEGKKLVRCFFTVRAAAWMVKTARELGDAPMEARYAALVERAVQRMCAPELGYDGKGWASGWDHFNSMKALALAHDATGRPAFLEAYRRALEVYTIDPRGIYRYGTAMAAPGGFETYSGALPLAVWGHSGRMDWVQQLIDLDVPNGWHEPARPVRDTWNDAGAGPWAQVDANPKFLGFSLKGARLPTEPKAVTPVGAFPSYDGAGHVTPRNPPMVRNPFFLPGEERPAPAARIRAQTLVHRPVTVAGAGEGIVRRVRLDGSRGAALDLRIRGDGYRVSVSPDGEQWFDRIDTYDPVTADQSTDISFLCGSREELVRALTVMPPADAAYLVGHAGTLAEAEQRRAAPAGDALVYRLRLPAAAAVCRLELIVGNDYRVELSRDGRRWRTVATAQDADGGSGRLPPGAAMIRMVDATAELARGRALYLRIADAGEPGRFAGQPAFVQRIAVFASFRSRVAWVRVANVPDDAPGHGRPPRSFTLERLTLRRW